MRYEDAKRLYQPVPDWMGQAEKSEHEQLPF
jgi:hypothetical protein